MESASTLRTLESEAMEIAEFLKITVMDSELEEDFDKSILSYSMISSADQSISIQVNFASMADLSQDILLPDVLEVRILRPDLIIDAETF